MAKVRNPLAVHALRRRSGSFHHKCEARGGSNNWKDLLDEIDLDICNQIVDNREIKENTMKATVKQIAIALGVDQPAANAFCNVLASKGILKKEPRPRVAGQRGRDVQLFSVVDNFGSALADLLKLVDAADQIKDEAEAAPPAATGEV